MAIASASFADRGACVNCYPHHARIGFTPLADLTARLAAMEKLLRSVE